MSPELPSRRPFQPFRLAMSSGQAHEVRYPEVALLTRTDILVGTAETGVGAPAGSETCSLLRVAAVEPPGVGGPK